MSKDEQLEEEVARLLASARPYAAPDERPGMIINGDRNLQIAGGLPQSMAITGDHNRQVNGSLLLVRRPGFWQRFLRYFYSEETVRVSVDQKSQ